MTTCTATHSTVIHSPTLVRQLYVGLQRVASNQSAQSAELLRQHGLSGPQYNVLRILRGADKPLNCSAISAQLLTREPDMTRLLDRLEKQGMISRSRDQADRRVVSTQITPAALALLATLDQPMLALHQQQFAALNGPQADELLGLIQLLNS